MKFTAEQLSPEQMSWNHSNVYSYNACYKISHSKARIHEARFKDAIYLDHGLDFNIMMGLYENCGQRKTVDIVNLLREFGPLSSEVTSVLSFCY